eukprot:2332415-Lingulodinium_polyedra.AAC.1
MADCRPIVVSPSPNATQPALALHRATQEKQRLANLHRGRRVPRQQPHPRAAAAAANRNRLHLHPAL